MNAITSRAVITRSGIDGPHTIEIDDVGRDHRHASGGGNVSDRILVPDFVDLQVNGIDDIDCAQRRFGSRLDPLVGLPRRSGHHRVVPDVDHRPARPVRRTARTHRGSDRSSGAGGADDPRGASRGSVPGPGARRSSPPIHRRLRSRLARHPPVARADDDPRRRMRGGGGGDPIPAWIAGSCVALGHSAPDGRRGGGVHRAVER